jgi:hypothetical protein
VAFVSVLLVSCASEGPLDVRDGASGPEDAWTPTTGDALPMPPDAVSAPPLGCAPEGAGELLVRLQLAPDAPVGDLWVAALCGRTAGAGPSDERMLRVVRVPPGADSVMLSGLGDGFYRVVASVPGAIPGVSGVAAITRGASAATFVSVGGPTPSALRVELSVPPSVDGGLTLPVRDAGRGPLDGALARDAGLFRDGSMPLPIPEFDAGPPAPPPIADYGLSSPEGLLLGRVGLRLNFREPGWVDASFDLENTCEGGGCPTLRVQALELRVEQNGLPRALVTMPLGTSARGVTVAPRELFATGTRLVPMVVLDRSAQLRLTVYGAAE